MNLSRPPQFWVNFASVFSLLKKAMYFTRSTYSKDVNEQRKGGDHHQDVHTMPLRNQ